MKYLAESSEAQVFTHYDWVGVAKFSNKYDGNLFETFK